MSQKLIIDALQHNRFLHDVSQQHLEQIAKVSRLRDFDELEVVFREGDVAQHVYLVVFGNVSLDICAPGVGCKRVMTVGPGEILGWSSMLEQTRMTATARTLEISRLVELDAAPMLMMCENDLEFGYEIMRRTMFALAKRLSATRMQLLDVYGSQLPNAAHATED
jgi:CRP/FNR family transcriptional regulator, cyclic AMP receptor protein